MVKAEKQRLDQVLVDQGLAESRSKAQALILAGLVFHDTKRLSKAGDRVAPDISLTVKGKDHPWVSRGGIKLAHGLMHFGISPKDWVCLDIGASTGGFTDVLLTHGARRVYAIDVGRGQLAWKLRNDDRVVVLEKTNCRHLDSNLVPEPADMVVSDVSFIGLEKALPAALALLKPNGRLLTLIKPQFEVGKGLVGKGGVVRDPSLHAQVCDRITDWVNGLSGWAVDGVVPSPIRGPEGNVEFLMSAEYRG